MSEEIEVNGVEKTIEIDPSIVDSTVPTASQKEITISDYIRKSLDIVASSEGFRDYELDIDHGSNIGDGFVGTILKVIIKDSNKSLSVLAKTPPQNKARRESPETMITFEREVFAYNVLIPELVAFQKEKKIDRKRGFYNFPKVYYADFDAEINDSIIVMEDLRDSGHRMWDKYKPIDLTHAKFVVSALGRLHALSFALKTKKPEQFQKFKELSDLYSELMSEEATKAFLNSSFDHVRNILDSNDVKTRQKFDMMVFNIDESMRDGTVHAEPYAVINHGDVWGNNMLFHYTKRGAPEEIVLIDWQIARYCSPIIDLVYFIFICTDKQLRDKHYDELINVYHRSLKELLDQLGCDTTMIFPFTAMLRQLKRFGKFGIISACFIVPWLQMKNEDLPDQDAMAEQMQNADPEALEEMMKQFIPRAENEETEKVNQRVRDIIHDGIKYGYL